MWHFSVKLLAVVLFLFSSCLLVSCNDSRDVSVEYETTPTFDVVIAEGKKLKLKVHDYGHQPLCNPVWYFNGRPVSKSRCIPSYGELVCPAIKREDAGRYDLWGGNGNRQNQARLIFSANVQVTKSFEHYEPNFRLAEVQDVPAPFERNNREWGDCFCSGVTGRCRMADNLYRTRKTYNLSSLSSDILFREDASAKNYLRIPFSEWFGNLITAYGGYMHFPVTEECYVDRSKPCVLMLDKRNSHRAIAYYLPASHDQRHVHVLMKESSWKLVNLTDRDDRVPEKELTKSIFMSTLSNIWVVYIHGHYRTREESNMLSLDMASSYDEGLGKVTTVEECDCHPGYDGLSCERCEKGYLRTYESISSEGICMSISDLWNLHKQIYRQNL